MTFWQIVKQATYELWEPVIMLWRHFWNHVADRDIIGALVIVGGSVLAGCLGIFLIEWFTVWLYS